MNLRDVPIRKKLTAVILGTSVAVLVMMGATLFVFQMATFRQSVVRQLDAVGSVLAANSTAALAFENPDDAREILGALRAEPNVTAAALYDRGGRLFARYPPTRPVEEFPAAPDAPGQRFVGRDLVTFEAVTERELAFGTLYLRYDTGAVLSELRRGALVIMGTSMAVVLAAAYALSRRLQRGISAPILALTATARAVSEREDYSLRAAKVGNDEVGQLTDSFNAMLTRLQGLTHELEQRVRQRTVQLEAANKELEAFSYSVSHDLRAPLRHIDGFAGLLEKTDGATVTPRGRGHLNQIRDSARQMGRLIDDLLVFARMGRSEMRLAPVDLQALAEETIAGLLPEIGDREVRWVRGKLPKVEGDRPMLRQVFVNLLSNAVKYTRPRKPAVIEFGCRDDAPDEHVFFVKDNGVGFEMKYASKLFGVFQRLHRADEFEGTGIGLANVQRIIHRHGGRVWAESQPDAGATFYFTLPKTPILP